MSCNVVVGYHRGPCFSHLQGEVASMGEHGIDMGPDWRGVALVAGPLPLCFLLAKSPCCPSPFQAYVYTFPPILATSP